MSEWVKTGLFAAVAAVLIVLALWGGWVRPQVGRAGATLEQFSDQGERFYPAFDPQQAASLEVIEYEESSGTARPFKVQVANGRWTIPSHYDYPADGADRLAQTAAGVMDLTKDKVQSDRAQDHETLGVVDPLDDTVSTLKGRGQRVTIRDASGAPLVDYIFGRTVDAGGGGGGGAGHRYVRLPGKKRTYAVKVDVELSTRFADWIETDLLDLSSADVTSVGINNYSIDEATGAVNPGQSLRLSRSGQEWSLANLSDNLQLDAAKVRAMVNAITRLTITGVRPKPPSLTADLRASESISLDLPTQISLQSKGFFVSQDGRLLSNEGEITVGTENGVRYTLRFGELLVGEGLAVSAGDETNGAASHDASDAAADEHRYLFITAEFDDSLLPPLPPDSEEADVAAVEESQRADEVDENPMRESSEPDPAEMLKTLRRSIEKRRAELSTEGEEKVRRLNERFAPWYYVISAKDFQSIRPTSDDLTMPRPPAEAAGPLPP